MNFFMDLNVSSILFDVVTFIGVTIVLYLVIKWLQK